MVYALHVDIVRYFQHLFYLMSCRFYIHLHKQASVHIHTYFMFRQAQHTLFLERFIVLIAQSNYFNNIYYVEKN